MLERSKICLPTEHTGVRVENRLQQMRVESLEHIPAFSHLAIEHKYIERLLYARCLGKNYMKHCVMGRLIKRISCYCMEKVYTEGRTGTLSEAILSGNPGLATFQGCDFGTLLP